MFVCLYALVRPGGGKRILGLVAWLWEFCRTLEIITRTLREVVSRVRMCGHHNPGVVRAVVACLREFCRTLEIIPRTLREVVNRVRLCGHHNPESCSRGEVHV